MGASKPTHARVWGKGEGVGLWDTGQRKSSGWRKGKETGWRRKGSVALDMLRSGRNLRPKKDRLDGLEGVEV